MKVFSKFFIPGVFLGITFSVCFFGVRPVSAQDAVVESALEQEEVEPSAPPLQPIRETEAYKQFVKKPQSEFNKLIFLMHYYHNGPFTIMLDGVDYTPQFAFPFAQVYLFTHYNGETAEKWIKKHCYRSTIEQNIIYLRFPDGRYEPARDEVLRGLGELEEAMRSDQSGKLLSPIFQKKARS